MNCVRIFRLGCGRHLCKVSAHWRNGMHCGNNRTRTVMRGFTMPEPGRWCRCRLGTAKPSTERSNGFGNQSLGATERGTDSRKHRLHDTNGIQDGGRFLGGEPVIGIYDGASFRRCTVSDEPVGDKQRGLQH